GDTITPMWISLMTTIIIRVPIAYGLAFLTRSPEFPTGRPESVFVSLLLAWISGAVINTVFYRKDRWNRVGFLNRSASEEQ
ncbi:MAG: MATE family efflux transporter, partial [Halanaerobiaceae bacterium]|nr:MATE family efflux transporter [Halanaerobiaceae bacterium]